ncbi:OmpA family protein [Roseomonas terrae]|uniref:OmpA family protein n=1 Tax=Neoroseomonas terrae TaxID=424799 RepID=A0ABS5ELE6_9PROT|nr:OmpA family protein [Neoroseomonas terrae]MBR0651854.1 OmpA family protein [Neoroseomonas terrae]
MRALLLATAAWLGAAGAAAAQPLSGVYIGGGAMLNFLQDSDVTLGAGLAGSAATLGMGNSGTVKYNLGYGGALAVGYGFGNGLRAELEGSYRYNEVDSISGFGGGGSFGQIRGSQRTYGMMANVLYEFDVSPRFRPYLGAGVGWMWTEWHAVRGTNSIARIGSDDTDSSFAYQLIAGFAVPISQRWALTLDYRFLQVVDPELDGLAARVAAPNGVSRGSMSTDSFNHSVMFGVRYAFGGAAPAAAAPPAVAPAPARTFLVFFDWNRADLNDRARQIISEAAQARSQQQVTRIEVNGYTDTSGSAQYNQGLSVRRANAVASELVRLGVPRQEIVAQGFGETNLLVATPDNTREPQNRRVEIILR